MFEVLGLDIKYVIMGEPERKLYQSYLEAKQNKDFAKSDEIRNELIQRGIM